MATAVFDFGYRDNAGAPDAFDRALTLLSFFETMFDQLHSAASNLSIIARLNRFLTSGGSIATISGTGSNLAIRAPRRLLHPLQA